MMRLAASTPEISADELIALLEEIRDNTTPGKTPRIYNLAMAAANTEYSQALDPDTKRVSISIRNHDGLATRAKFAFNITESGTLYKTIQPGETYEEANLSLSGKTIYIQCNKASRVAEIVQWT